MRTGASGMTAGVSQMTSLGTGTSDKTSAAAAMQFPLAQRRKRRVLFTQAQVF